jgi:hypothetical protein
MYIIIIILIILTIVIIIIIDGTPHLTTSNLSGYCACCSCARTSVSAGFQSPVFGAAR